MNYLVAVLPTRTTAEKARDLIKQSNIVTEGLSILGQGYQSADEYGLVDPRDTLRKRIRWMATWLIPFGTFGGITFTRITNLDTFAYTGQIGNYAIGGLLGGLSGLLGSVFVGGAGTDGGIFLGKEATPYRKRIAQGKYLLVITGSDQCLRKSNKLLREVDPESLQIYGDEMI